MTDKRFVIKPSAIVTDSFVIIDKEKKYTFPVLDSTLNYMFCKALNELYGENENLKQANSQLAKVNREGVKKVQKLAKENEQLKSENNMLKHTIGRNEAYIKKLTETSEWHC